MSPAVKLIAEDGCLSYPNGALLLCVYDAGDCDVINWPEPDLNNLRRALYDGREAGLWYGTQVVLPNGAVFTV